MQELRIGITGAGGFIGSRLIRRLAECQPAEVRGLVRSPEDARRLEQLGVQAVQGDLTDAAAIRAFVPGLHAVVHLAARLGNGSWNDFYSANVEATRNLAVAALHAQVSRFVYVSSIEAYGVFGNRRLTEETPPQRCGHVYADSKAMAEEAVWENLQGTATGAVVVRPGMVFGPGSEFWTLRLYQTARSGRFLLVDGGRGAVYPVYIDDLVDALLLALTHPQAPGRTFNIVEEGHFTWRQWVEDHMQIAGRRSVICVPGWAMRLRSKIRKRLTGHGQTRQLEVMTRRATISSQAAREILGWRAQVGYARGMQESAKWLLQSERFSIQN